MSFSEVIAILAAASAIVSAVAAAWSAKMAGAASRPFVIASTPTWEAATIQAHTTLSNEGPGPALEIRWRAEGTGWSETLRSLKPGQHEGWAVIGPSLPDRWKNPYEINDTLRSGVITIEFSSLDGTRWRIRHPGSGGRPQLQRLTPRWIYFLRRIDDSP